MLYKKCLNCNIDILVSQKEVNRGNGKFCSRSCALMYRHAHITKPACNYQCSTCAKPIYIKPSRYNKSKSKAFFCSLKCKHFSQTLHGTPITWPKHYGTGKKYYRIVATQLPQICNRCKYDEYPQILVVHHKDRNHKNNELANLEILCPNCHAIEHLH